MRLASVGLFGANKPELTQSGISTVQHTSYSAALHGFDGFYRKAETEPSQSPNALIYLGKLEKTSGRLRWSVNGVLL
jgi:hypothetical protein